MNKNLKSFILLGIVLIITTSVSAQNYKWTKGYGGTSGEVFNGITADSQKNTISVGVSSSSFVVGTNSITNNGSTDILIVKNDFLGNLLWVNSFGSSAADFAYGVHTDVNNNIYVCGGFSGSMIVGTNTLTSLGGLDMFIIKLSPTGLVLNTLQYGGSGNDAFSCIAINSNGDIFAGGYFSNSVTFGSTTVGSAGGKDLVITKISSSFVNQWVKKTGASADDEVTALSLDLTGNIFVTGKFQNIVVVFPPSITQVPFPTVSNPGNVLNGATSGGDVFVLKQSASTGNFIWAISIWSGNTESSKGITCDDAGNYCYVVGDFNNSSTVGSTSINSNGGSDGYLAKFSGNDGVTQFVKTIGSSSNESSHNVSYSKKGIAVVGDFQATSSFGNGVSLTVNGGIWDSYVALYDSIGTCKWAKKAGGSANEAAKAVTICNHKHVFFGGQHASSNFQTPPLPILTTSGSDDAFISRIDLVPDSASICVATVDTSSNFNIIYWDKTGLDTAAIDSFIIYRASPTFIQIGSKHKADTSLFRDMNFSVNQTPNNIAHAYKLGTKDAFGNYSSINNQLYHKVIFLTATNNTTVTTLNWNNYSDNNNPGYVVSYDIYKDALGTGSWTLLANGISGITGTNLTYNDLSPSGNPLCRYFVEMNLSSPCFYSASKGGTNPYLLAQKVKTKSNQANEFTITKLNETELANHIKIYPNPAKDKITVELGFVSKDMNIEIQNVLGQTLYSYSASERINTINSSDYESGIYFVNIKLNDKIVAVKKVVIQ